MPLAPALVRAPLSPLQRSVVLGSLFAGAPACGLVTQRIPSSADNFRARLASAIDSVVPQFAHLSASLSSSDQEDGLQLFDTSVLSSDHLLPAEAQSASVQGNAKQAPLFRFGFQEDDHNDTVVVSLTFHKLIMDATSARHLLGLVVDHLIGNRGATTIGSVSLADFSNFVNDSWLRLDTTEASAYWKQSMQRSHGPTSPHPLFTLHKRNKDHNVTELASFKASPISLTNDMIEALHLHQGNNELSAVVCAAWALVLNRYSNEDVVTFGFYQDARESLAKAIARSSFGGINSHVLSVGQFESVVPLVFDMELAKRTRSGKGVPIAEFLTTVRNELASSAHNSSMPAFEIQHLLNVNRALYSTTIHLIDETADSAIHDFAPVDGSLVVSLIWNKSTRELKIEMQLQKGSVSSFDTVGSALIQSLLSHLECVLQWLLSEIAQQSTTAVLGDAPLMEKQEEQDLLHKWDNGVSDLSADDFMLCPHERFEQQANTTPDSIAITEPGRTLTYRELSNYVEDITVGLLKVLPSIAGPSSQTPPNFKSIGLLFGPSIEQVATIIATLKTGIAYIPLDQWMPKDRVLTIFQDVKSDVLLTCSQFTPTFQGTPGLRVLLLDDILELSRSLSEQERAAMKASFPRVDPRGVSHVLFTSGSTGRPKIIMATHFNYCSWFQFFTKHFEKISGLPLTCTWGQASIITFDASQMEIWYPLWCGGRIVVVPREARPVAVELRKYLIENAVNAIFLTPSRLLQLIAADIDANGLPALGDTLKMIIVGGEIFDFSSLRRWYSMYQAAGLTAPRFMNFYGPTETVVCAVEHLLTPDDIVHNAVGSNIGKPWAGFSVYMVDADMRPVPYFMPGDIFIAGLPVSPGYVDNKMNTVFQDTLFWPRHKDHPLIGRMYKCGDIGWRLPNDDIIFIGRRDAQIKFAGTRIEIEEIETAIVSAYPVVQRAVVVLRSLPGMPGKLVGYLVLRPGHSLDQHALRTALGTGLPAFMIPSEFHLIDDQEIRFTSTGKLDRRAMNELDAARRSVQQQVEQQSEDVALAQKLAEIWTQTLRRGARKVEPSDNMMALILARHPLTRLGLVNRFIAVAAENGIPIAPQLIFMNPTPASQAKAYLAAQKKSVESENASTEIQAKSADKKGDEEITDIVEGFMLQLFREVLDNPAIRLDDPFFEIGGSSILAIYLINKIQEKLNVTIPFGAIAHSSTPRLLTKMVHEKLASPASRVVMISQGNDSTHGTQLFFIHPAFRTCLCFMPLAKAMPPSVTICGMEEAGAFKQFHTMEEMAREYAHDLVVFKPSGPFHLVGWSFGGLLAFAIARELSRMGRKVVFVGVIDEPASVPGSASAFHEEAATKSGGLSVAALKRIHIYMTIAFHVAGMFLTRVEVTPETFVPIVDDENAVVELFVRVFKGIIPGDDARNYVIRFIRDFTNAFELTDAFDASRDIADAPDIPITLFKASEVGPIKQEGRFYLEEKMGWDHCTKGPVEIVMAPGSHDTLVFPPHTQQLANLIHTHALTASTSHS